MGTSSSYLNQTSSTESAGSFAPDAAVSGSGAWPMSGEPVRHPLVAAA
jgi:hypothetical protein